MTNHTIAPAPDDIIETSKDEIAENPDNQPAPSTNVTASTREGLALIRMILDQANSVLGEQAVERTTDGAYLYLIQGMIGAMTGMTEKLPLEELVKLSSVLAEQRRAASGERKPSKAKSEKAPSAEGMGALIQQLYGTSFASDIAQPTTEESPDDTIDSDSQCPHTQPAN